MLQKGPAPVFWIKPVKPALDHSTGSHYPLVSYVLEQQLHIGFTVKSAFTGVDAIPVDKLVIFSGEHVFPPDRRCHLFLNVSMAWWSRSPMVANGRIFTNLSREIRI
jgi:hypothetical protein